MSGARAGGGGPEAPPDGSRTREDRFRLLFEHSSDPHLIVVDGRIADCNEAAVKILGCASRADVLKFRPSELSPPFQPDGRASAEKSLEMDQAARQSGLHRFEWVHRRADGGTFPVQVTLNAVEIDGSPGLVVVWHDLTELKKKEAQLRRAHDKMKRDLEAASMIQRAMLPLATPLVKGLRAAWSFRPCDDLGGDILNIFMLDDRHVGLYVLDVTGHGIGASLLSVAASHFLSPYSESSFVRSAAGQGRYAPARPAEVAEKLNRHFSSHPDLVQFFTLLYGILDVRSREFCYVCAGHPLPIVVSAGRPPRTVAGAGLPIGVTQDFTYTELCLKLAPGDRLYLYSDGITEARNEHKEPFGEDALAQALADTSGTSLPHSLETVVERVESWCRPGTPDDDITLLACELDGGS